MESQTVVRCSVCKVNFSRHSNLRIHVKKFHPGRLNEIAPNKNYKELARCDECNKPFTRRATLTAHIAKFHPDKLNSLTNNKTYKCKAEKCYKQFSLKRTLKRHEKAHSVIGTTMDKADVGCFLCEFKGRSLAIVMDHYKTMHDIEIKSENFTFSTLSEFKTWKLETEEKNRCFFVNRHGSFISHNEVVTKYVCHRSGNYVAKANRKRHLKIIGSNKINAMCPASMKLKKTASGKCEVVFTKTHVGHENDVGHLNLSKSERDNLAIKIASKIPFEDILDDVRESVCNSELKRLHLLDKKDLYNIKSCYNLCSSSVRAELSSNSQTKASLDQEKEKLKRNLTELLNKIDFMKQAELDVVKKFMGPIQHTLAAVRSSNNIFYKT